MATRARVDCATTDPTRKSPRDCAAADFAAETHNLNMFCQVRRSKFDWWNVPPDLRILGGIRQWDAARLDIRAVSVRLTAMACCGKDNEEKETGVSLHRSRAIATRHERAETHAPPTGNSR